LPNRRVYRELYRYRFGDRNRLRKGAPWLKTTLVQCAWAAVKKKDSYLQAQFYRIKARRGPKKAIMAVAAASRRRSSR
jgi:hypothetical protein